MLLLPGRCEFIEKYFEVIAQLQRRGFNVVVVDWRGQGQSSRLLANPSLGHIEDFAQYRTDLHQITTMIVHKAFPGPYYILAHSMGGCIALQALGRGLSGFDKAILCAPMTSLFSSFLTHIAAAAVSTLYTMIGAGGRAVPGQSDTHGFEGNKYTSDKERYAMFETLKQQCPQVVVKAPTMMWLRAAITAMNSLHHKTLMQALKIPVLIISAGNDRVVQTPDHIKLADTNPHIRQTTIDGARHEIMMESPAIRAEFWQFVDRFLDIEEPA